MEWLLHEGTRIHTGVLWREARTANNIKSIGNPFEDYLTLNQMVLMTAVVLELFVPYAIACHSDTPSSIFQYTIQSFPMKSKWIYQNRHLFFCIVFGRQLWTAQAWLMVTEERQKFHAHTTVSTLFTEFRFSFSHGICLFCHRKPVHEERRRRRRPETTEKKHIIDSDLINSICLVARRSRRRRPSMVVASEWYTHPKLFRLKEIWISDDEYQKETRARSSSTHTKSIFFIIRFEFYFVARTRTT